MNYVNIYSFMLHMIMYINVCYTLLLVVVVAAAATAVVVVVVVVAVVVVSSLSLLNLSLGLVVKQDFC